ncbi:MAG: hypothetical protein LLG08_00420 [Actinomycetia bacterium]|nr:hypothetical protein [Actinomycetes bacterium]
MALNLTADQIAALRARRRVRQQWSLYVPESIAHAAYEEVVFHDPETDHALNCVVKSGKRTYVAVNFSPLDTRKLQTARHAFQVSNADGSWYPFSTTSRFTHSTTAYQAAPQECRVRHRVYVLGLAGSWLELTCIAYVGRIASAVNGDSVKADGTPIGNIVTIETEAMGAAEVLSLRMTKDHAYDTDVGSQWEMVYRP